MEDNQYHNILQTLEDIKWSIAENRLALYIYVFGLKFYIEEIEGIKYFRVQALPSSLFGSFHGIGRTPPLAVADWVSKMYNVTPLP